MLVSRTSYSPPKILSVNDIRDHGAATHFVSVAYNHSHFVVLYYDIAHREVIVYDGLSMSLENWAAQIIYTIKNCTDSSYPMPNAVSLRMKTGYRRNEEKKEDDI
jgi:hypothetical protein